MDGTLLNTEDIYTEASNELLAQYGKGPMTWDVKIKLQGRPGTEACKIFIEEYDLSLTPEELFQKTGIIQESKWIRSKFLPGALELVEYLKDNDIPIALGTSSHKLNYERKTNHLKHGFKHFGNHIVTGDDKRIPPGKGKPNPHIWFACLDSLNDERKQNGLEPIKIEECLIFEDGVTGVVSGVAANSHVIWIPDPNALKLLNGEEHQILNNRGEILESLLHFDKRKYSL